MMLTLRRLEQAATYTFGELLIDGTFECWTLEDPVREGPKVHGATAIPPGVYVLTIDFSRRFGKPMPHILDVPGFEGIRMHSGNKVEDTDGCVLVGTRRVGANVFGSRAAYGHLFARLNTAHEAGVAMRIEVVAAPPQAGVAA